MSLQQDTMFFAPTFLTAKDMAKGAVKNKVIKNNLWIID